MLKHLTVAMLISVPILAADTRSAPVAAGKPFALSPAQQAQVEKSKGGLEAALTKMNKQCKTELKVALDIEPFARGENDFFAKVPAELQSAIHTGSGDHVNMGTVENRNTIPVAYAGCTQMLELIGSYCDYYDFEVKPAHLAAIKNVKSLKCSFDKEYFDKVIDFVVKYETISFGTKGEAEVNLKYFGRDVNWTGTANIAYLAGELELKFYTNVNLRTTVNDYLKVVDFRAGAAR